jgi:hypothetical protein
MLHVLFHRASPSKTDERHTLQSMHIIHTIIIMSVLHHFPSQSSLMRMMGYNSCLDCFHDLSGASQSRLNNSQYTPLFCQYDHTHSTLCIGWWMMMNDGYDKPVVNMVYVFPVGSKRNEWILHQYERKEEGRVNNSSKGFNAISESEVRLMLWDVSHGTSLQIHKYLADSKPQVLFQWTNSDPRTEKPWSMMMNVIQLSNSHMRVDT